MAKFNLKNAMKALGLLGLGATIGHVTQVIFDYEVLEDEDDINALGRFSRNVCKYWRNRANEVKEAKNEIKREEETTVDETDDEWDAWKNTMTFDDLSEEPSE